MAKLALLLLLLPITQLRAGQDTLATFFCWPTPNDTLVYWSDSPSRFLYFGEFSKIDSVRYHIVETTTGGSKSGVIFKTEVDSAIVYFRRIEGITATRYVVRGALERLDHERWLHGWYPEDWVEKREED